MSLEKTLQYPVLVLTMLLIALKLAGATNLTWLWVFSPVWVTFLLYWMAVFVIVVTFTVRTIISRAMNRQL